MLDIHQKQLFSYRYSKLPKDDANKRDSVSAVATSNDYTSNSCYFYSYNPVLSISRPSIRTMQCFESHINKNVVHALFVSNKLKANGDPCWYFITLSFQLTVWKINSTPQKRIFTIFFALWSLSVRKRLLHEFVCFECSRGTGFLSSKFFIV